MHDKITNLNSELMELYDIAILIGGPIHITVCHNIYQVTYCEGARGEGGHVWGYMKRWIC